MIRELRPLGTLTTKVGSGATPRGGNAVYRVAGTAFIRSQNVLDNAMKLDDIARITDEAAEQLRGVTVQKGDVLLNITGDSIARTCMVDPAVLPARVSQHVTIIRTDDRLDGRYLQRFLVQQSTREHLLSISDGGTRRALTKAAIDALLIPVPPIPEQQAIAEVLGALDDKIAANARLISTTEQLLNALSVRLLSQSRSRRLLGELVTVTKGVSYRRTDLAADSDTAMVTLKSITRNGRYTASGLKGFVGDAKSAQHLRQGDIVVAQTDLTQAAEVVGRAVRVPSSTNHRDLVASLDLAIVRPRVDMPAEYLLAILRSKAFRQHCRDRTSGTTVLHLGRGAIESFTAPWAEPEGQFQFARRTKSLHQLIDTKDGESEDLVRVRDVLLPQLMSGKIRVTDAERVVDGVV